MSTLEDDLSRRRQQVDEALEALLVDGEVPAGLARALRRSLFPGGKRLRPICVLATAELLGRPAEEVLGLACALELVHSASLVLDDLPAMDDATVRRGQPALHLQFGEATAILVAIALLSRAFGLVAETGRRLRLGRAQAAELVTELARTVGAQGMAAGQYVDLTAPAGPGEEPAGRERTPAAPGSAGGTGYRRLERAYGSEGLATIEFIHSRKTGRLFVAAFGLTAVALGADQLNREALTGFGRNLGLAFQVTDDILSVTADGDELGKRSARDERRVNFATLFGLDPAHRLARELVTTAVECLAIFGERAEFLRDLARFVLQRRR